VKTGAASGTPKKDSAGNRALIIGVKCDEQFSVRMNGDSPFLGTVSRKARCRELRSQVCDPVRFPAKRLFASLHRGHLFVSRPVWSFVVFFTAFANVRPVSAFFGEPASLPDPPPDDATWRACAPKWRRCSASCPPQSRSRGHPSRALEDGRAGGRRNTRAAGSPQTPRAGTYIYIYIDFAKPKAASSGTITSTKSRSRVRPKKHRYFCNSKRPSFQLWGAQRSQGSDQSDTCSFIVNEDRGPPNETLAPRSKAYDGRPMFVAD
jgi:hypothetical protein